MLDDHRCPRTATSGLVVAGPGRKHNRRRLHAIIHAGTRIRPVVLIPTVVVGIFHGVLLLGGLTVDYYHFDRG